MFVFLLHELLLLGLVELELLADVVLEDAVAGEAGLAVRRSQFLHPGGQQPTLLHYLLQPLLPQGSVRLLLKINGLPHKFFFKVFIF